MELGLVGKTAIVTGGASHIGRRIALDLANEGANLVIADIDGKQSQQVSEEAKLKGWNVTPIDCDVTSMDSVENMVKKTLELFGQIDILINNAGWTADRLFVEKPRQEWEKEININLWGPINCIRAVLDHMIERRYGKIISIDSDAGRSGEVREVVYGAAKAGAIGLTKGLAKELGRYNINVNAIGPGYYKTQMTERLFQNPENVQWLLSRIPMKRTGVPEDLAGTAVFLASEASDYITGQIIYVDGGWLAG